MYKQTVDTVCVMVTCSPIDVVKDQIEALQWGCLTNKVIVIVDDRGNLGTLASDNILVFRPCGLIHHPSRVGFKANEAIEWILDRFDFKMLMILDDDALVLGKGIDLWALNILQENPNVGILGVKDDVKACGIYSGRNNIERCLKFLQNHGYSTDFEYPLEDVFYAVTFQSYAFAVCLKKMGLLAVEMEQWPLPCESFQSAACKLSGFDLYFHGQYPNCLLPPLYVMHHGSVKPPDPRLLNDYFLVHHSIRQVSNVDEWEIRNFYKTKRET